MADEEYENECVHLQARRKRHHTNEGRKLKWLRGVGFVYQNEKVNFNFIISYLLQ